MKPHVSPRNIPRLLHFNLSINTTYTDHNPQPTEHRRSTASYFVIHLFFLIVIPLSKEQQQVYYVLKPINIISGRTYPVCGTLFSFSLLLLLLFVLFLTTFCFWREREYEYEYLIELGHLPVSVGKGGGGGTNTYTLVDIHVHFTRQSFNDLLNTQTRKRNHQNIPYMVSA